MDSEWLARWCPRRSTGGHDPQHWARALCHTLERLGELALTRSPYAGVRARGSDADGARRGERSRQHQRIACSDFPKMPVSAAPRRGQSLLIQILCVFLNSEGLSFPMLIAQHVN